MAEKAFFPWQIMNISSFSLFHIILNGKSLGLGLTEQDTMDFFLTVFGQFFAINVVSSFNHLYVQIDLALIITQ